MKRSIALLVTLMVYLVLTACSKYSDRKPILLEFRGESDYFRNIATAHTESADTADEAKKSAVQNVEVVGAWHLDDEKNDLAAFAASLELFPGYGEWDAAMEIQRDGQMSWYIGAESWHGTYTVEDMWIYAQMKSDLEQSEQLWVFHIVVAKERVTLEMAYGDLTIHWAYGDREAGAKGDAASTIPGRALTVFFE